jgi:two-component system sensor histidine kinase BaeS
MKGLLAKILAAQILSVLLALLVMVIAARVSLQQGFLDFLERQEAAVLDTLAPVLADIYVAQGGWDFLRDRPAFWQRILRRNPSLHPDVAQPGPPHAGRRARPFAGGPPDPGALEEQLRWLRTLDRLQLRDRLFLLDGDQAWVAGAPADVPRDRKLVPVEADGETVGWIGFAPMDPVRPPEVDRFLGGQLRTLTLSLLLALGLAAALGLLLARHLSRPVRELETTVRELAHGHFERRAEVTSGDEIGGLANGVNRLAETLEKNRTSRQRWMADIAHELRTPVAILKGEIEALTDGVREPDQRAMLSLGEEIDQLTALVDDLQTLALADAGSLSLRREPVDVRELVQQVTGAFRDRLAARDIALELDMSEPAPLRADAQRLRQLLQNLLENCARYVEAGGRVRVLVAQEAGALRLTVEDSGPGVGDAQLPLLFERFYRVEPARSRAAGGRGLGLSICRNIVEAHGGTIGAERSTLGGLAIQVRLPG